MSLLNPGRINALTRWFFPGLGVIAALSWSACRRPTAAGTAEAPAVQAVAAVGDGVHCVTYVQGVQFDVQGQVYAVEGDQASVGQPGGALRWVPLSACEVTQAAAQPASGAAPAAPAPAPPPAGITAGQPVVCRVQEGGGLVDVHGPVQRVQGDQVQVAPQGAAPRWLYAHQCQVVQPHVVAPAQPAPALAPGQTVNCRVQEGGAVYDIQGQIQSVSGDQVEVVSPGAAPRWIYAYSCLAQAQAPAPAPAIAFGEVVLCRKPGLPKEKRARVLQVHAEQLTIQYDAGHQETLATVRCRRDTRPVQPGQPGR